MITKKIGFVPLFLLTLLGLLSINGRVSAHALGQETLSRHSLFQVSDGRLKFFYSVDMAEDPTFFELQRMDYDGDGSLTEAESEQYIEETAVRFLNKIELTANESPLKLNVVNHDLQIHLSGHELPVLYLTYEFEAPLEPASLWDISYYDENFSKAIGWQEVVVQGDETVQIQQSTAPNLDLSAQLTAVPEDLSLNPVQRSARFVVTSSTAVEQATTPSPPLSSTTIFILTAGLLLSIVMIALRQLAKNNR